MKGTNSIMTRKELEILPIKEPSRAVFRQVKARWDQMAKPLDSLGRFEELTAQIGSVLGTEQFEIRKKAVVVFCADNGIVEEGVSQSGQEVTLAVARAMGRGESSVAKMAKRAGADVIPVDVGINCKEAVTGVLDKKIMAGTRNFIREPAMTETEALKALETGICLAEECKKTGYRLLAAGEMGIGNTTTSAAVAAAITGCRPEQVIGRGAGLSDADLHKKQQVVSEALKKYQLQKDEPLRILCAVGGLDLAAMAGFYIGCASVGLPVVLDGVISVTAALLADRLKPGVRRFLIPSHRSKEPAAGLMLKELGLYPVLDASLALGEGTGAVMLFALLDVAMSLYENRLTFSDIEIAPYERQEITGGGKE